MSYFGRIYLPLGNLGPCPTGAGLNCPESAVKEALREEQWGLDPLFRSFPKLFIKDILTMPPYPTAVGPVPTVFCYNNHPIGNADVLGVIVKVYKREKCVIYDLDDGTGVISCLCWKQGSNESHRPNQTDDLPTALRGKLQEVTGVREQLADGFNLGDLLHVRGKIKVFNGARELMCSYHAIENDPNAETLRILETVAFYKKFYDLPLVLPKLSEENAFDIKIDSLKITIQSYIEEKGLERLSADTIRDILKQEDAPDDKSIDSVISKLLSLLEESGLLYKAQSSREYIVSIHDLNLQKRTLEGLRKECKKAKYAERGCPVLRMLEALRTLLPYVNLQRAAVGRVLHKLEEDSEVISLEPNYYQPLEA